MKTFAVISLLFIGALACSKPRVFGGWIIQKNSVITDSGYVDGVMEKTGKALAIANMVCPDSTEAQKKTGKSK